MKNLITIAVIALSLTGSAQTKSLMVTSEIVTSIDEGKKDSVCIVAHGLQATAAQSYNVQYSFYADTSKAVQILAVFKSNQQVIPVASVTLAPGVEASTTTILQALKAYLEDKYSWTIEEVTN